MTITNIIKNEISIIIGHNPSSDEFEKFIQYIRDMISDKEVENKKVQLSDVQLAIYTCCDECFRQCEECGEYFLPEYLTEHYGKRICENETCKKQAADDYNFDPHTEWGTDNRHTC